MTPVKVLQLSLNKVAEADPDSHFAADQNHIGASESKCNLKKRAVHQNVISF
jgi:hypothetical protein